MQLGMIGLGPMDAGDIIIDGGTSGGVFGFARGYTA
jgi:hypothetical protein